MRHIVSRVPIDCIMSLSANLRNTFEIASLLRDIRIQKMENEKDYIATRSHRSDATRFSDDEFTRFDDVMSLRQSPGHFIHGPAPNLYYLHGQGSNKEVIMKKTTEFLKIELAKLKGLEVAVIVNLEPIRSVNGYCDEKTERFYKDHHIKWKELCNDIIDDTNATSSTKLNASVHFLDETLSAEWPAVIGIVELSKTMLIDDLLIARRANTLTNGADVIDKLLSRLYIVISRARVYSSVIFVLRGMRKFPELNWRAQISNGGIPYDTDIKETAINRFLKSLSDLVSLLRKHMLRQQIVFYDINDEDVTSQICSLPDEE